MLAALSSPLSTIALYCPGLPHLSFHRHQKVETFNNGPNVEDRRTGLEHNYTKYLNKCIHFSVVFVKAMVETLPDGAPPQGKIYVTFKAFICFKSFQVSNLLIERDKLDFFYFVIAFIVNAVRRRLEISPSVALPITAPGFPLVC